MRIQYRMRGEALTRRFLELFSCSKSSHSRAASQEHDSWNFPPLTQSSGKRTFSQLEYMDRVSENDLPSDEVNKYLLIDAAKFGVEPKWFESDKFAVIKFSYERRNQFPCV